MRHNWILLILVFALCNACKQKTIDFSYSPTQPRAGQSVAFTNGCDFGEEWAWNFGDNTFSTLKTPSHTFRKPGTYTVTLMVDSTARHSISKTIEVVDTLPTIGCAEDSILYFMPELFTVSLWNPFKYKVSYQWQIPEEALLESGKLTDATIEVSFTTFGDSLPMQVTVDLNGTQYVVKKKFYVHERPSQRILTRTLAQDYGQRLFGKRFELVREVNDSSALACLAKVQDTVAKYGSQVFTRTNLPISGHESVEGFMIDQSARKIYLRDNGLYVANINGSNPVCLDSRPTTALVLDHTGSRVYYANAEGVWRLPLLQTPDNRTEAQAEQVNSLIGVQRLAVDATKR